MAKYSLNAKTREITGKKTKQLREQDLIPAVLYGQGIKNQNISLIKNDFNKIQEEAGSSNLIDLNIDEDKSVKVLIQDFQKDATSGDFTHVDLYQIKEGQKITTDVQLKFSGEAPAVKELSAILVKNIDRIEIECLAQDLEKLEDLTVDLSGLETFDDVIYIKDLLIPEEIKVLNNPDDAVVIVTEPKEEIIEQPEEAAEGEEGAEGEGAEGEGAEGETKEGEAKEGEAKDPEQDKK